MRNRSSSKGMGEREEQPHLSGAYIRSLVKQLSHSSRTKGCDGSTMSSPNPENGENPNNNNSTTGDKTKKATQDRASEENKAATPHKKQVRRRLHTTRPYQERLLNMAEARREIVTALKIHRSAMKQAKEKQQQQQQHQQMQLQQQQQLQVPTLTPPSLPNLFEAYQEHPLNYGNMSNYLYNTNNSPFQYPSSSWPWPQPTIAPITPILDNFSLDFPLPSQPLGLNLNFQGFNTINSPFSNDQNNKLPSQPSPTSSNSPSYSSTTPNLEAPQFHQHQNPVSLHPVMDAEEMAVIYSIGEKHDIEWNDTVNLVTSAWWSKFLKSLEEEKRESTVEGVESNGSNYALNEALNAPTCFDDVLEQEVTPTSSAFEEQLFGFCQADPMEGADLPQLDIGELEGWDGEWLSQELS